MCKCEFCTTYDKYKWAKASECKCSCHTDNTPAGHDSLCCEFPNAFVKDNPYTDLKPSSYYKEILDRMEDEEEIEVDKMLNDPEWRKEAGLD